MATKGTNNLVTIPPSSVPSPTNSATKREKISGAQQAKKGLGAKNDSALYFWKRGKTGDSGQKKETREDNGCLL